MNNRYEEKTNKWILGLPYKASLRMWIVVSNLYEQWQLRRKNTFNPHLEFERLVFGEYKTDYSNIGNILVSLDEHNIVRVFLKNDSQTISLKDNPDIAHDFNSEITVNPPRLEYLYLMLKSRFFKKSGDKKGKRWCSYDYESKTFQIYQNSGQILALTFRKHNEEISGQTILFEVGYELWGENILTISRSGLLNKCSQKIKKYGLIIHTTPAWLKNTRINLRTTVKNSQIANLIEMFEIDKLNPDIYHFSIKQPS